MQHIKKQLPKCLLRCKVIHSFLIMNCLSTTKKAIIFNNYVKLKPVNFSVQATGPTQAEKIKASRCEAFSFKWERRTKRCDHALRRQRQHGEGRRHQITEIKRTNCKMTVGGRRRWSSSICFGGWSHTGKAPVWNRAHYRAVTRPFPQREDHKRPIR